MKKLFVATALLIGLITAPTASPASKVQARAHVSCWYPVYTYACYYGPWSDWQLSCDWVFDHWAYYC